MNVLSSLSTTHYRAAALFWTLGILGACLIPADTLGGVSPAVGADKVAHVVLFGGFGALWMRGLCPPDTSDQARLRRWAAAVLLAGACFAAATEVAQHLAPIRRVADPYDLVADLVGLTGGVVAYGVGVTRHWALTGAGPGPS